MNALESHAECCGMGVLFWGRLPSVQRILRGVPDAPKVRDCWRGCAAARGVYVAWTVFSLAAGRTSRENCWLD